MVSAAGAKLLPVRTGYEQIIAHRCGERFATEAAQDGKVLEVTEKALIVHYKDGTEKAFPLGGKHGKAAGAIVPHADVTDLKPGNRFKAQDILVWNPNYFERDRYNPGGVSMKGGVLARTALMEIPDTLEDGSVISPKLSEALGTPVSKMKSILVRYDQAVENLVSVGEEVDLDTVLCTLQDEDVANIAKGDGAMLGLSKLSAQSPKAKFKGRVGAIEVFYMGPDTPHPTLAKIIKADNKRRKEKATLFGSGAPTGEILQNTYVNGEKITPNTAVITIYMDANWNAGIGDKAVFDNCLKTIPGRIMEGRNETEDGQPLDAIFGYQSISARIVANVEPVGLTNSALLALGRRAVKLYRGE